MTVLFFRNVSLFPKEEFGFKEATFKLEKRGRYFIQLKHSDQMNTLLGILEGRYREYSGTIHQADRLTIQSDRLLLGEKVYSQTVEYWLALKDDHFFFDGRRRSKYNYIQNFHCRGMRHLPIYKLRDEQKIKFALLALTFQESGLIILSQLLSMKLNELFKEHLKKLIQHSRCTLCVVQSLDNEQQSFDFQQLASFEAINIQKTGG